MKFIDSFLKTILLVILLVNSADAQSVTKSEAKELDDTSMANKPGDEFAPTRVLAIVGGEPIFVGDMLFEVNQIIARFMPNAPESIIKEERGQFLEKLLPKYIEQKMLLIDVKAGLPAEANFDDIIESAASDFDEKALEGMMKSAGVTSPVVFDAHLRAQGSSLRKMRKSWTVNQIVRYFLSQKIKSDAEVSHKELLKFYRDNQKDYEIKAKARWEQVMVRHERFASTSDATAAIVELGNKIVYGASLDGVAKKSSHGFLAHNGGQHDWTTKGALVLKELDAAIFSLPVGQLSDIIKTKHGLHIIRVLERNDAGKVDFVEAQVEIKKKLESDKRVAAFDAHMAKLKKSIPVEYLDGSKPAATVASKNAAATSTFR